MDKFTDASAMKLTFDIVVLAIASFGLGWLAGGLFVFMLWENSLKKQR